MRVLGIDPGLTRCGVGVVEGDPGRTPRLLLAAQPGCALDDDAFRALGFTLSLADTAANVRVYHYDLDTYKTVPDWLNARFWANPERWEP